MRPQKSGEGARGASGRKKRNVWPRRRRPRMRRRRPNAERRARPAGRMTDQPQKKKEKKDETKRPTIDDSNGSRRTSRGARAARPRGRRKLRLRRRRWDRTWACTEPSWGSMSTPPWPKSREPTVGRCASITPTGPVRSYLLTRKRRINARERWQRESESIRRDSDTFVRG